ncbi:hypothetical protein [Flavivirga jejuensis]|uniref:Tetratricopeptide repeat protein n=1 Tax=Flavivirga jejuensis TaxID=870487 RepID=A0ABT8WII6_9FLAO|nr:hypothetical protein [Flavivirga jejuensis]MDO5972958.1 hypothetical protein [Flavivirga jejuensis]
MNKTTTLVFALLIYAISFSQNANLDREYVSVSYIKLPSKPILDNSKRTYSSNIRAISLSGFSRVKSNGTLDINYNFNGTQIGEVDIRKTKHEKKDKDGKVTSTSYTYKVHIPYTSSASLSISNAVVIENNYNRDFSENDHYESNSFSTYKAAQNHYNNNRYNIRNKYTSKHKKSILNIINSNLNTTYGYVPANYNTVVFWILGNKKHPEYQKHMENYGIMKAAFAKMKYDQPVSGLKTELEPVIDYFNSLIPKYVGTKKKMAKMRYASYYNIAKMYYYLDMPEKAKEYAEKLIENDYDKSHGKHFIRISDELLKKFEINETNTRHFEVITEDLTNIEEAPEAEEASGSNTKLELVKAYLISKVGDTILVDIETKDVKKIAYEIRTVQYADNGTPVGTKVENAKDFNEVLFVDGTHYKNVMFKESGVKNGNNNAVSAQMLLSGAAEKLCKVLFESDKINLYHFNNEEPVIFTPGSEKGKSTLSTGYVFGFKKNLVKLAKGCPALIEKAENKTFKNTPEDLMTFCKELASCK